MENSVWFYSRIREVKPLSKGSEDAAGVDIHVPEFDEAFLEKFLSENKSNLPRTFIIPGGKTPRITVGANGGRVVIPSGIKFKFPTKQMIKTSNRSGMATKKGLIYAGEVVDPDYQGEYGVGLINTSDVPVDIFPGDRIVQIVRIPVFDNLPTELPESELYTEKTQRAEGGFGSTGR